MKFVFKSLFYVAMKTCMAVTRNKTLRFSTALLTMNSFVQESNCTSEFKAPLEFEHDKYDGVIIKADKLPNNREEFLSHLKFSLEHWKATSKRGIWLKIPSEKLDFAALATNLGFVMHHAENEYLMMTNWLSEEENKLPPNASHQIGIGAVVINNEGKLLAVQEKNGPLKGMGVWKVPTGLVDAKEDLHTAACREVKEETGIETEFVGLLCFRHAHNFQFGKSDLFFVCLLKPLSTEITKQESEIAACEWIDFDKYMNQSVFMLSPLHTKLNTFIKLIAEDKDYKNYLERFSLPIGFRPGSNMLYMPMTSIPTSTSASITAR